MSPIAGPWVCLKVLGSDAFFRILQKNKTKKKRISHLLAKASICWLWTPFLIHVSYFLNHGDVISL